MLTVSTSKASTGSNHTVAVLQLDWLAVLTLSRARMVRRVVFLIVGHQGQVLALLNLLPLPSSPTSAV